MNDFVKVAIKASRKAAKLIQKSYGKVSSFENKRPSDLKDFLTTVDRQAENLIIAEIQKSFPNHGIWGEESGKVKKGEEYMWVIDSIDGTKNFVRGLEQFAISIGLVKGGKPRIGVIYNPLEQMFFWAVAGEGTFSDKKEIHISQTQKLKNACISLNLGKTKQIREFSLKALKSLSNIVPIIRIQGSTAYTITQLVQGKFDALVDNGDFWDWVASIVIVKEAGGMVSTWKGEEVKEDSRFVLWSNGLFHNRLVERLSSIVDRED